MSSLPNCDQRGIPASLGHLLLSLTVVAGTAVQTVKETGKFEKYNLNAYKDVQSQAIVPAPTTSDVDGDIPSTPNAVPCSSCCRPDGSDLALPRARPAMRRQVSSDQRPPTLHDKTRSAMLASQHWVGQLMAPSLLWRGLPSAHNKLHGDGHANRMDDHTGNLHKTNGVGTRSAARGEPEKPGATTEKNSSHWSTL